jgi:hypothetical protein
MNIAGEMKPRVGWRHRTSASHPTISRVAALLIG